MRRTSPLPPLLLAGAGHAERRLLARNVDVLDLPARSSLLTAPGPATEMLLLLDGEVRALDRPELVHGPGTVLGAAALLTGTAPVRGYRTTRAATIGFVSRSQARRLMTSSPVFATAVAVSLAEELLVRG